ncbi:MAG: glutamate racemase [Methylocystaceae bacterium]|jgi:glutamate racemase|nr:glutamate racemase [Methylocystaceae bacterium]NBT96524.1 glutamate racemase [Methylocystaceae bacterium]
MNCPPKILIFDSGLGGLTVFSEIIRLRPNLNYLYCADDAGFPYGSWNEAALIDRVIDIMSGLIATESPDMVVIACNTASTLVLSHLRRRWPMIPFIGTVPAIKPAGEQSRSHLISVLATPGTVKRDYTQKLITQFAGHCQVTLVGSSRLAGLAEQAMHHGEIDDAEIITEITPCFVEINDKRTDTIVLACTHYPLLLKEFHRLAPWPVNWINPAPAIARRVEYLLTQNYQELLLRQSFNERRVIFTSGDKPDLLLKDILNDYGLQQT